MLFFEFLIFVIAATVILYLGLYLSMRKQKIQKPKSQVSPFKFALKNAFTNKNLFVLYPIVLIILMLLSGSLRKDFIKALPYKKMFDEGKVIQTDQFQKNIITALESICGLYLSVRPDEIHDEAHEHLWNSLMNLKEIIVKMSFASKNYSVEDNYSIKSWLSERYIDGNKFYSTTNLKIKKEGAKVHEFKFWFSPGIIKIGGQQESYIRFYAKPLKKESQWRAINYRSYSVFNLANQAQKINEIEAQLNLREDDFNKDGYAEIKIEIKHEQTIPYSLYYLPVFRYTKEIEDFKLITYFKDKLEEYMLGCYDTREGIIWWSNDCTKFKKPSENEIGTLVWKPIGNIIENVWSYTIELQNYSLDTILFKYRQQWSRWTQLYN